MKKIIILFSITVLFIPDFFGQNKVSEFQNEIFWNVNSPQSILWDISTETRLPHNDNIEMSGQFVSGIIHYEIDDKKKLQVRRHLIYPQLRVFINSTDSKWLKYRAYLKKDYEDNILPVITTNNKTFEPGAVDSVVINGMLNFYHAPQDGLLVKRTFFPSMSDRLFVETWMLENRTDSISEIEIGKIKFEQDQKGIYGEYKTIVRSDAKSRVVLNPGENYSFAVYYSALLNEEPEISQTFTEILQQREAFLDTIKNQLILKTPDAVLNNLFYFSKIRAAESIFRTSMGLVHSPGGGRYYTGVWANDQAEYSGPFFPYLGYETGDIAALNAYRVFINNIPEEGGHFWSSFEMNGELTCCGADRGDAAMIAFGAAHFALACGKSDTGKELWPLIEWCLDYCDGKKNEAGVITSDSDEMEGRIPTGDANLSTSSLYYGALLLSIDLGKELKIPSKQLKRYKTQAEELNRAIESYFGATIEDLETYKYFEEHQYLRHWICLPLVMGINDRKDGTLDALFTKLWTNNGVRVEYNPELVEPDLFWDRGTLYAFRGAFKAGATNRGLEKLKTYSETRLLGFHVPYVVEAWPEGNMAHLSAESALYCRIFTEGLLGINPVGFHEFEITPGLPDAWDSYSLNNIRAFHDNFDITISRDKEKIKVQILKENNTVLEKTIKKGEKILVRLK